MQRTQDRRTRRARRGKARAARGEDVDEEEDSANTVNMILCGVLVVLSIFLLLSVLGATDEDVEDASTGLGSSATKGVNTVFHGYMSSAQKALHRLRSARDDSSQMFVRDGWERHRDGDTGRIFYYSTKSGESSWQAPEPWLRVLLKQKNVRGDWARHLDASNGEYFYENLRTSETMWDVPKEWQLQGGQTSARVVAAADDLKGDWRRIKDVQTGDFFYYNVRTEKKTWDKPAEWQEVDSTSAKSTAASQQQQQQATKTTTGTQQQDDVRGEWRRIKDEASGKFYYHNVATDKTTWDTPSSWKPDGACGSFRTQKGRDIGGADVVDVYAKDESACCKACSERGDCKSFVFRVDHCWMKHAWATDINQVPGMHLSDAEGIVVGVKNA